MVCLADKMRDYFCIPHIAEYAEGTWEPSVKVFRYFPSENVQMEDFPCVQCLNGYEGRK